MSEAAGRHASVVRVGAQDPEGGAVTFAIVEGDPDKAFTVGESTGEIRVMGDLDRETRAQYELVSQHTDIIHIRKAPQEDNFQHQHTIVTAPCTTPHNSAPLALAVTGESGCRHFFAPLLMSWHPRHPG